MVSQSCDQSLKAAVQALKQGGVVLHATEGVWGFACDPHSQVALEKIFTLKRRHTGKGLLLIGARSSVFDLQLEALAHSKEVLASWPGHHTWVLPNHGQYSSIVTGGRDTVACRVPGHDQARQLCHGFGRALISTSANRTGAAAITDGELAQQEFSDLVDYVLPGAVGSACQPSTLHALDGSILR